MWDLEEFDTRRFNKNELWILNDYFNLGGSNQKVANIIEDLDLITSLDTHLILLLQSLWASNEIKAYTSTPGLLAYLLAYLSA